MHSLGIRRGSLSTLRSSKMLRCRRSAAAPPPSTVIALRSTSDAASSMLHPKSMMLLRRGAGKLHASGSPRMPHAPILPQHEMKHLHAKFAAQTGSGLRMMQHLSRYPLSVCSVLRSASVATSLGVLGAGGSCLAATVCPGLPGSCSSSGCCCCPVLTGSCCCGRPRECSGRRDSSIWLPLGVASREIAAS